jgi:hypothetical protein
MCTAAHNKTRESNTNKYRHELTHVDTFRMYVCVYGRSLLFRRDTKHCRLHSGALGLSLLRLRDLPRPGTALALTLRTDCSSPPYTRYRLQSLTQNKVAAQDYTIPRDNPALSAYWRWFDAIMARPAVAKTLPEKDVSSFLFFCMFTPTRSCSATQWSPRTVH